MVEVAKAYVSLIPETKGWGRKVSNQIGGDLGKAGVSGGKRLGAGVRGGFLPSIKGLMGPVAALFAVGAVVRFFKSANAEARESQKVGALTANVIKTTGGVAKITAGQVGDLATAISNKTGIDDEAIQHGANLLLTFKNIRNEVGKGSDIFDRATAAAADLAASGFGDIAGASKMLGKALNDPLKGITALGRAGVTFSEGQKKQIKTMVEHGNLLGAQKLMMIEVESQVGGAAAASATAGEKLATTWGNLKEMVGTALLPALDTAMTAVSGFFGGVMSSFQKGGFSQVFTDIGAKISASWPGTKAKLGEWLSALGGWIWGTALPVIGAQLAKWGVAFWAWIQPQIVPMLTKLGILLGALGTWLLNTGVPWLGEHLKTWGIAFWAWIQPMIPPFLAELGKLWVKLEIWMNTVALPALIAQLAKWAWSFIKWVPGASISLLLAMDKLAAQLIIWMVSKALPAIVAKLGEWALAFIRWIPGAAVSMLGKLGGLLGVLTTWASGVPGKIGDLLVPAGKSIVSGLIDGIGSMASAVGHALVMLLPEPLRKFAYLLGIHSPSTVFAGFGANIGQGLIQAIDGSRGAVEASMTGLVSLPRVGSLDFASSGARSAAVAGSGIDLSDRTINAIAAAIARRPNVLDGRVMAASVDQRLAPR